MSAGLGEHHPSRYSAKLSANVFKRVHARYTENTLATLWDPGSTKKFQLMGGCLSVNITVILANAVVGGLVVLCDNVVTAPLLVLGQIQDATQAVGPITYTFGTAANEIQPYWNQSFDFREGYISPTKGNILKLAVIDATTSTLVADDIDTGMVCVTGLVWGREPS